MSQAPKNAQQDLERQQKAQRKLALAQSLHNSPAYQELCVNPHKEQALAALAQAMKEARKPAYAGSGPIEYKNEKGEVIASFRNDARVSELLRDYMTFNEIANAVSNAVEDALKRENEKAHSLQKAANQA